MTLPRAKPVFGTPMPFFGVVYDLWARHGGTPLWLRFHHPPEVLRRGVETLRQGNPDGFVETASWLNVPIELPVGKERGAVLDAVVAPILEIARLLAPDP